MSQPPLPGDRRPIDRADEDQLQVATVGVVGSGGRRRSLLSSIAVVFGIAALVGVGVAGRLGSPSSTGPSPSPAEALASPSTSAEPTPSDLVEPSEPNLGPAPSPALPRLANGIMAGAPVVAFGRRSGADIELLTWSSGAQGMQPVARLIDAAKGLADDRSILCSISPSGRHVLVHVYSEAPGEKPDLLRLFRTDTSAKAIWSAEAPGSFVTSMWGPGDRLAIGPPAFAPTLDTWTLVELRGERAIARSIAAPGSSDSSPAPASPDDSVPPTPALVGLILPVGFSADGQWLYGATSSPDPPRHRPAIRIATAGNLREPIDRFPVDGLDRVVTDVLDPATNRSLERNVQPDERSSIEAWDGDRRAFHLEIGYQASGAWVGDGRIAVLDADRAASPGIWRLALVDREGHRGEPLVEATIDGGAVLSSGHGFVVIGLGVFEAQEPAILVAIVRAVDGATSTLRVPDYADLQLAGVAYPQP